MAKQIARLLKTNMMADIDMPALAQFLRSQGRKGDTVLAHINPKEAALLQKMGGAGTENPDTGLPEFYVRDFSYEDDIGNVVRQQRSRQASSPSEFDFSAANTPVMENDFRVYRDVPQSTRSSNQSAVETQREFPIYENFQQDPSIPQRRPGVYQRLTGNEMPEDLMQMSPFTRAYDAATGNRVRSMEDPYNQALSTFTPSAPTRLDTYFSGGQAVPSYGAFQDSGSLTAAEDFARRMDVGAEREGNFLRRGVEGLKEITGLSGSELAQLGLAGGLGIQGALAARNLAEQGEEARAEQEAIAAPYRERGAALLAQAEGGQLTPQAQQSLQAMRARLAQGAEARGGVGAQQVAAQVEAFRQQLLANQYDYGMKVSNIGDNLMLGAIRTGLEADRYATQMTNNYYTNMARILAGMGGNNENAVQQGNQIQQQVRGSR